MTTFVLLLKGINVGGHKKIPMADLRDLLTKSGFKNVKTYIQSGNVILESAANDIAEIESDITAVILKHFGFQVSVLVKTRHDLERIFNSSPFFEEKKKASYFIMLHKTPDADLVREASKTVYEGEAYHIINDCMYFYCEAGFGQAKFNVSFIERKLNTFATARNYNTMLKLLSLSA
ncbi:DUF1697 domain-containing protein [Bizionia hallyeonensis]|uniref:DUF1697 domain-containing protein n=1 Tax=Bizionia hallyeonensis TaxID=1123757 RepID=A0ABW0C0Q5_9FLAO